MYKKLILTSLLPLLLACSNDPYDSGDGSLSLMRADFVEASTDASSRLVGIATDDGDVFTVSPAAQVSWVERPDTVYRALAYYNRREASSGANTAELLGLTQVLVPDVVDASRLGDKDKSDPVVFWSAWKSRNGKYINLDLDVKTGKADGKDVMQYVGISCETSVSDTTGKRLFTLKLLHDRNGAPEYYSSKLYVSIPLSSLPQPLSEGDEVEISIATYDGTVVKSFSL